MRTTFIRLLESSDRAADLRSVCRDGSRSSVPVFSVDVEGFRVIGRSTFAYWASPSLLRCFSEFGGLEADERHAAAGASTKDNARFIRCWWEPAAAGLSSVSRSSELDAGWVPLAKGGAFGRFYADVYLQLRWALDGRELKAFTGAWRSARGWGDHWKAELHNSEYYGRPGLTWPSRSQVGFGVRPMPAGGVFGDKGPTVFCADDDPGDLGALLSVMNSEVFRSLVALQMAFGSYETGVVQRTPLPRMPEDVRASLADLSRRAWSISRSRDVATETSHAFLLPILLLADGGSVMKRATSWAKELRDSHGLRVAVQQQIDAICVDLYQIDPADLSSVGGEVVAEESTDIETAKDDEGVDGDVSIVDPADAAAQFASWCVGVAVGRFDVRLATGERAFPSEPDPFGALPICSPGMLTGANGMPVETPPVGYQVDFTSPLVYDVGHPLDMTRRVREVFDVVFSEQADRWWSDVGDALGERGLEVGSWLSKGFFDQHLKDYSRSRRKAPIYWPVGTASGSYFVWLYAHRVTNDSLFRVLNDLASPKLDLESRRMSELVQEAGPNPSVSQRKAIDLQEKFVEELRQLVEELTAAAPLWHPDLNDGIVLVLAPLWKLFAHHKAWSKELRKHWESLAAGQYDWAQLAMHLWPERVVPQCAEDRSLAIAHGMEDVFWIQDEEKPDKWHPRRTPTVSVETLIADRTDPATKAAVEDAVR